MYMKPARLALNGDLFLGFPIASGRLTVIVPKIQRYFELKYGNFG